MKNINVKKIVAGAAALAVGASFLGAAVAAQVDFGNAPTKGDVINSSTGMPSATVVVGTTGTPGVDSVWAGNIAAAIASKAYTTETHTTDPITVPGQPGSSATITGDGYLKDNVALTIDTKTSVDSGILENFDYSKLIDKEFTGRLTGESIDNSYKIKATESLRLNTTTGSHGVGFLANTTKVQDFIMTVASGQIVYAVEFDDKGIPFAKNGTNSYFKLGDRLTVPFMGKEYSIQKIENDKIILVDNSSKQVLNTGGTLSVTGTDGTAYTLEIGNAYGAGDYSKIQIKLLNGSNVVQSKTFAADEVIEFYEYPLNDSITIIEILDDTSNANMDMVELSIGSNNSLELKHNEALPGYKSGNRKLWRVELTYTDATGKNSITNKVHLSKIAVVNDDARWDRDDFTRDDSGIKIGESIELPLGLGSIDFVGLTTEKEYTLEIGDNLVKWQDSKGRIREVFMYESAMDRKYKNIDGRDYYFDTNSGNNLLVYRGTEATGTPVINTNFLSDTNKTVGIMLAGSDSANPICLTAIKDGASDLILALNSGTSEVAETGLTAGVCTYEVGGKKAWSFNGIYASASTYTELAAPNDTVFNAKAVTHATDEYAVFTLADKTNNAFKIFVDPNTKDLAKRSDYDNSAAYYAASAYGKVQYWDTLTDTSVYRLDNDDSDDLRAGYGLYGTMAEFSSDVATFTVPENALELQVFIGGGSTTVIEEGQPGSTIPGQTYTTHTPVSFDAMNLVKLDTSSIGGTKIIVGGHAANRLAAGITEDYLTQDGDWVMGKDAEGNIIVAGWTGADTGAATRAFIEAIR